jgi:hypothetical protein
MWRGMGAGRSAVLGVDLFSAGAICDGIGLYGAYLLPHSGTFVFVLCLIRLCVQSCLKRMR